MKELITEEGADHIILVLSILIAVGGLSWGFYKQSRTPAGERKALWVQCALCALVGPVVWGFWGVYNSIENYYGLDSLKALKINFFIAIGIAAVFAFLFTFVPKWVEKTRGSRKSK